MATILVPLNGVSRLTKDSTLVENSALEIQGSGIVTPISVGVSAAASTHCSSDATPEEYDPSLAAGDDPACIVGMACRLPGGIRSPSELWTLLANKKTTQGRVPSVRFNIAGYYHPDGKRAGAMDADGGYFLDEDVRKFDNNVFAINNLEATYMDPQQRKLLEVTYECFESAGLSMEAVSGSDTAVYVGNFTVDYQTMQTRDPDYLHRYSATGSGTAIMANRISHVFNLHGPSFTLDTACSSSIYGLHNAVMALRNGDCKAAVVAGANLITSIEQHLGTMKGGVLSPTSTCHTFDASADGYGRGEAVNAIYIKPLSQALRDGDNIRAVIRGTAINSNGRTNGITQPSATLQEAVIRKAYKNAGIDFDGTDYVECHGTGTAVGDPVEVEAIGRSFAGRDGPPLMIGAIKTNVGHSEAASGLSAVIKAVLAFEKNKIPPTYGVKKLNPKLRLDEYNLQVVNELSDWPRSLRRASINSFGYGGANAHVILEALDSYLSIDRAARKIETPGATDPIMPAPRKSFVLPISAKSKWSLLERIGQITDYVKNNAAETLTALAVTLTQHRAHLEHRAFLIVDQDCNVVSTHVAPEDRERYALPFGFVFTGQGAQYAGMGKELLLNNASFKASIKRLDGILQAIPKDGGLRPTWTLEQTLLDPPETSMINDVTRSQPVCTAVQIGLVDLIRSWGVEPSSVVGHSSGEIAAAYAAGRLTAGQAIQVAFFRGVAVARLTSQGGMLAAGLTAEAADELIAELGLRGQACVACFNAPESVTLSGELRAVETLRKTLEERGKFARALKTGGRAYHSHMMTEVGALYEEMLEPVFGSPIDSRAAAIVSHVVKMYSSVGRDDKNLPVFSDFDEQTTAKYWRANLETAVQFTTALANLTAGEKVHLIEIGPHAALKGPVEQIRKKTGHAFRYSPSLLRGEDADTCILTLAGNLFSHSSPLNMAEVHVQGSAVQLHDLPPYPWDYSGPLLWSEPRPSVETRNREYVRHELLGASQIAGNGIDWGWRNLLRLSEVPWIRDHKLESQIVFPATAYIGLIMEALGQVCNIPSGSPGAGFEFRNVNIGAALVVQDTSDGAEIHTTLSARKISTANKSTKWYDFSISSWDTGESTLHCSGSVRLLEKDTASSGSVTVQDINGYETWSMGRWYAKLSQEGLCFGPHLQSITSLSTDGSRVRTQAISTTKLFQHVGQDETKDTNYTLHPIVLDACLQAGIFGGTGGDLNNLRAFLPVFIESCRIWTPAPGVDMNLEATIHTSTRTTGFASKQIDCTLRDSSGTALVEMKTVRLSLYNGRTTNGVDDGIASDNEPSMQRQPCLSVQWKPDILRLHPNAAYHTQSHLTQAVESLPADLRDHSSMAIIVALVGLASFKNPRMRVLELGAGGECLAKRWLETLEAETTFPRCRSWVGHELDSYGKLVGTDHYEAEASFDTIIVPTLAASTDYLKDGAAMIASLVNPQGGVIVTRNTPVATEALQGAGFSTIDAGQDVILAIRPPSMAELVSRDAVIVIPGGSTSKVITSLSRAISDHLQHAGVHEVKVATLGEVGNTEGSVRCLYISLLEIENEFLATVSPTDMDALRRITDVATRLIWLTGADMLGAKPNPDLTLSSGLSRALMLEQPSLRYQVLDVGACISGQDISLEPICANLTKILGTAHEMDDHEYILKDGILNISRFIADKKSNSLFRRRLKPGEPMAHIALGEVGPARLAIGSVGQTDTLYFAQESQTHSTVPPPDFIDIQTKAVSLNAKDIYTASGRVETRTGTAAIEFSGIVVAVGKGVTHLAPGDHAVVLAPNRFSIIERVPAWAAHKMLPAEEFCVMPTLPVAFGTALYALDDRAHLRAGESILVHSGAGAFGMATIVLAQRLGAVVYATVGSPAKKKYLVEELGLPAENIFSSRDSSFVQGVHNATGGHGVDVIINSLVGDLMHDSWDCIADFGRFVEVGKRELVDAGKLDMAVFLRNCTFTAFDLTELFFHKDQFYRDIWIKKTKEALELYRTGQIKPVPIATFDVSNISQGYRFFSAKDRIGKVVISMENPQSCIPVLPSRYSTKLHPEKVYLLIGCLGGLGRSLSRWMMALGARNFVFLGRSGTDKPEAEALVSRLRGAGADVKVVRGDVSSQEHVDAAVDACAGRPIGGVVQAAMGLSEALFCRMTNKAWHTGIQPKWAGSWNVHRALERDGREEHLDFFLLTSSVSGTVGTATESNYCAANGFLDAFARYRHSVGKPAVSIGLGMISEVGYLHENPEIEALLLRKGIQPLNEDEFLQVVDFALAPGPKAPHILTGLEPFGLLQLIKKGFEVENGTTQDPRAGFLAAALLASQQDDNSKSPTALINAAAAAPWFKAVPAGTAAVSLAAEASAPSLKEAALRLARKRFSNLILLPLEQIDDHKPLPQFGVDSMIAAEYRTWFWSTFKVDVPFLDIMSPKKSLDSFASLVGEKLIEVSSNAQVA